MRFSASSIDRLKLELEREFDRLTNPVEPVVVPSYATGSMPDAGRYPGGVLLNTTLGVLAVSNGTAWLRADTGAAIA